MNSFHVFAQEKAPSSDFQSSLLLNDSDKSKERANDVQRDQSAPPPDKSLLGVQELFTASPLPSPTDSPFISYPVTKTPGKTLAS